MVKRNCRHTRLVPLIFACLAILVPSTTPLFASHVLDLGVEFDNVISYVDGADESELNRGLKTAFIQRLSNAKRQYERGRICTAANILQAHLNHAQAIRKGRSMAIAETLFAQGHALREQVIGDAHADDSCYEADPASAAPVVEILASDNEHFAARVSFGDPTLLSVEDGGETWTQLFVPGLQNLVGNPGHPAIPSWQSLVAIPRGAEAGLLLPAVQKNEALLMNLYPFQGQAADQSNERFANLPFPEPETFMNPPFVKNEKIYETPRFFPPSPCAIMPLGMLRDLQLVQVQCNAAQYNPVTDEMILFDSVEFEIVFDGGDGNFVTTQTLSPFETSSNDSLNLVLNREAVGEYVEVIDLSILPCFGEELMILTHPSLREAADDLAAWKNDKGILTRVFEVGAGTSRPTAADIDDLIEDRYQNCSVRPSYVLIMGDSELVPPARLDHDTTPACNGCGDTTTGSDWQYGTYSRTFLAIFPYFGVGRIPVDSLSEAQVVVDKTIEYESSPPFVNFGSGGPFYTTASAASYFQCCRTDVGQAGVAMRTFVETAETARNAMVADGYAVERIYTTDTGYQGDPVADPTPRRYYDGSLLPTALSPGNFNWDGDTQDVIDAFNEGRFLIFHRDHGGSTSWGDPSFNVNHFPSLTNGDLQPFVYGVNCASGFWDRETDNGGVTESFMERLLMLEDAGMVAGLGDNRNSPTWPNSALTRGFIDATFPAVAPEFGSSTPKRRLTDIMNHGKLYLLTQIGVAQPGGSVSVGSVVSEWIMWHAFGDPTTEMWTSNPYELELPLVFELLFEPGGFVVEYPVEGAEITLFRHDYEFTIPIGRAMVENGTASGNLFAGVEPGEEVSIHVSYPNAVSLLLTPQSLQPDLVVRLLDLTDTDIQPGQDLGPELTVFVENAGDLGTRGTLFPDGSPRPVGVGYMVDLVLSSDMAVPPGFAAVPQPPGVAYAEDGLLQAGRISRTPDLAAGQTLQLTAAPPISSDLGGIVPLQAPLDDQYLCAQIDPGNVIAESNENNNVTCILVTVVRE